MSSKFSKPFGGGSERSQTSKTELFVKTVNIFSLTLFAKSFVLDIRLNSEFDFTRNNSLMNSLVLT